MSCLNSVSLSWPPSHRIFIPLSGAPFTTTTTAKPCLGLFPLQGTGPSELDTALAGSSLPFSAWTYHNILDRDNRAWVGCFRYHINNDWINILRKFVQKILQKEESTRVMIQKSSLAISSTPSCAIWTGLDGLWGWMGIVSIEKKMKFQLLRPYWNIKTLFQISRPYIVKYTYIQILRPYFSNIETLQYRRADEIYTHNCPPCTICY